MGLNGNGTVFFYVFKFCVVLHHPVCGSMLQQQEEIHVDTDVNVESPESSGRPMRMLC